MAGTLKSVSLGFLVQITLGVGLIDLAAVGHQDQLRKGNLGVNVNLTRAGGRVHLVATCILDLCSRNRF